MGIEENLLNVQCHVFADSYFHVNHGPNSQKTYY